MAQCAYCGKETQLFDNGVPICVTRDQEVQSRESEEHRHDILRRRDAPNDSFRAILSTHLARNASLAPRGREPLALHRGRFIPG